MEDFEEFQDYDEF
jgi:hypothetical protein